MTKVLIADDDPGILESMGALLELYEYETVAVRDAELILPRLREERPTVLLQDVNMPGLDLETHIKAVRDDPALGGLTIILFTGESEAERLVEQVGAQGALPKPFDPDELTALIEKAQG